MFVDHGKLPFGQLMLSCTDGNFVNLSRCQQSTLHLDLTRDYLNPRLFARVKKPLGQQVLDDVAVNVR
jgi:hypothetical protein